MVIMPDTCCHPQCHAHVSAKVEHAYLCDAHLVAVYRSVRVLMDGMADESAMTFRGSGKAVPGYQRRPGLIYFLRFGDRIKIGFTTNLHLRMQQIPHDELLATVAGTMADEKHLHARFAEHRLHHEWFAAAPELLAHIEQIKADVA